LRFDDFTAHCDCFARKFALTERALFVSLRRFAKAYSGASAVFVDELDAGFLQCSLIF
jgi:hypothetical protein